MRFNIILTSKNKKEVPIDYRRYFISFLKSIFEAEGIYTELFDKKTIKPYTFSVWFGNDFEFTEKGIKGTDRISFLFSTGDKCIFTKFYNGLLNMKDVKLWDEFKIENIILLPPKKIVANKILCKTIGISIFTDPEADAKDFSKWFITPKDDILKFNEVFKKRIVERARFLNCEFFSENIKFSIPDIEEFQNLKKENDIITLLKEPIEDVIVKHYNGNLKGFRGFFGVEGDVKLLNFIYDYGIGVRTGQGFGMIDVLKEI